MRSLFLIFLTASFLLPALCSAAETAKSPIEIKSRSMVAESKKNLITFEGSVTAKKDNITLSSERMVVSYDQDRKIRTINAYDKVRLIQENREITSDQAVYFAAEEKVVFTGNPVFSEEGNTVTGSEIVYYIASDRAEVKNSRVILNEQEHN